MKCNIVFLNISHILTWNLYSMPYLSKLVCVLICQTASSRDSRVVFICTSRSGLKGWGRTGTRIFAVHESLFLYLQHFKETSSANERDLEYQCKSYEPIRLVNVALHRHDVALCDSPVQYTCSLNSNAVGFAAATFFSKLLAVLRETPKPIH